MFPLLAATLLALLADRRLGAHVFDAQTNGPLLWQHLFWFFGHPEVYIVALPFFGIVTEIIPVFSRKPLFGYRGMVFATIFIFSYSMVVWAHHMYATGAVLLPFFSATTFLIAIPTGVKFFNWIGTMWKGQITLESPMLFSVGFLATFLLGGLTGVLLASPPNWFPKITGRMLDDRLGKVHFWTMFIGFHMTFLVQHWLGAEGMARRYADYLPTDGLTALNMVSTIGSFVLGCSTLFFIWNVWKSYRFGPLVTVDDPWGFGNSLEWATSCPPPLRNFDRLPRIRSERPAFDLKYGTRVADLGRDLRQGDVRAPQNAADELRPDRGPHHSDEVVSSSGARAIDVPAPEHVRRDDRPAGAVGGDPLGPDERDRPTDPRWRSGGLEGHDS